jgi:hypothetical protein
MDDTFNELIESINKVKHNVRELIPVTINLMFEACLGIIEEDHRLYQDELIEEGSRIKHDLSSFKRQEDAVYDKQRTLLLYLRKRVMDLYTNVNKEDEENTDDE